MHPSWCNWIWLSRSRTNASAPTPTPTPQTFIAIFTNRIILHDTHSLFLSLCPHSGMWINTRDTLLTEHSRNYTPDVLSVTLWSFSFTIITTKRCVHAHVCVYCLLHLTILHLLCIKYSCTQGCKVCTVMVLWFTVSCEMNVDKTRVYMYTYH